MINADYIYIYIYIYIIYLAVLGLRCSEVFSLVAAMGATL